MEEWDMIVLEGLLQVKKIDVDREVFGSSDAG
jgi:hypothetical protein